MSLMGSHMSMFRWILAGIAATAIGLAQTPEIQFFESKVRPLLAAKCYSCHSGAAKMGGLDLSTAEGLHRGAASGPIVTRDNPEASHLLEVIGYQEKIKMPPSGRLSDQEIADVTTWVKMGTPWPGAGPAQTSNSVKSGSAMQQTYWWSKSPRKVEPPTARDTSWARNPVDRFILAKLEEKGLKPAPPAVKQALLRRATYDLTGLPPTPQEVRDFLADNSPDAFAKVVDRLLASPRYGERWGRHWLDVARYADSNGLTNDRPYPHAWRYRDYVIGAFNRDLPYDQFVMEQIAGDLLPPGPGELVNKNGIIATGFLAIGPKPFVEQDKVRMVYDAVDEQIDTTSRAFLGLTVSCARCHDHKFDAISAKDYYSMAAIFASTRTFGQVEEPSRPHQAPLVPADEFRPYEEHLKKIAAKQRGIVSFIELAVERHRENLRPKLAAYMKSSWRVAKGETADTVTADAVLDAAILKKWVAYFQAKGPEVGLRPHLDEWINARVDNLDAVIASYEKRYEAGARRWKEQWAAWDKEVEAVVAKGLTPIPRPPFIADSPDDRFFSDVGFDAGPFGIPVQGREKLLPEGERQQLAALRKEVEGLRKSGPPEPPMASAVAEGEPVIQRVHLRGNYKNIGEEAPPGFPRLLTGGNPPQIAKGSGRLELAKWLARPDHPLTARVMANRIWQWHFGAGLTPTANNFGKQGEAPTHPELLDYLAAQFVESGWSIKAMHRLIMLSSAYQMSSSAAAGSMKADPANRLLTRFERRRLTIEEIRDSMLAMDGSVDMKMGGTLVSSGPMSTQDEGGPSTASRDPMQSTRRTVYLPLRRANLLPLLSLFDFGDAATSSEGRMSTNVAPQALFMLNSDFVDQRAKAMATKLLSEATAPREFIARSYLTVTGREPEADELAEAADYLAKAAERLAPNGTDEEKRIRAAHSWSRLLLQSNEFIYVD